MMSTMPVVIRRVGGLLQILGLLAVLGGLYLLVGPAWTALVGGVLLMAAGTLVESGLLRRAPRPAGGA
jgi:hypothetical protein